MLHPAHQRVPSVVVSRSVRGVVPVLMPAGQGPQKADCPGLDRPAHNQVARAHGIQVYDQLLSDN